MKTNLQSNGQITGLSGKPYEFYKQVDINDFHKYLIEKYHEHTGNSYRSYFEKYASMLSIGLMLSEQSPETLVKKAVLSQVVMKEIAAMDFKGEYHVKQLPKELESRLGGRLGGRAIKFQE